MTLKSQIPVEIESKICRNRVKISIEIGFKSVGNLKKGLKYVKIGLKST